MIAVILPILGPVLWSKSVSNSLVSHWNTFSYHTKRKPGRIDMISEALRKWYESSLGTGVISCYLLPQLLYSPINEQLVNVDEKN